METIKWGAGFLPSFRTSCQEWLSLLEGLSCSREGHLKVQEQSFHVFYKKNEGWKMQSSTTSWFLVSEEKQPSRSSYPLTWIFFFQLFLLFSEHFRHLFPSDADKANWISGWMKQKRKESGWGCKILTNLRSFWISSLQNISILKCEATRETFNIQLEEVRCIFFFLFFTQIVQFGLKMNLVNSPKAVRHSKRAWSVLSSFRMKNLWEQRQKLGKKCRKLLEIPVSMQFHTPFRPSSNLHI